MMKKHGIIALVVLSTFFGCSNHDRAPTALVTPAEDTIEKKADTFFPVTDFLKGQVRILDSLPVTPLQLTTVKEKTDSAWLTKPAFKALLQDFLNPVISETNLTKYFKETKFKDLTLNAITFTYDPKGVLPDSIPLLHWDVYVNPESGKVDKIYIVKKIKEYNQSFIRQLTWKTDKMAKISTILNEPDGKMELVKEVSLVWDFSTSP